MSAEDQTQAQLRKQCEQMVQAVEASVRETAGSTGIEALSAPVREALLAVPRHRFVPRHFRHMAYLNRPLSIGSGQTISQPFIVAIMTELSGAGPGSRVLEVGTGSGYQAAVLAELGAEVYTIETIPELARAARERLAAVGYERVFTREGDGSRGWPEQAPYDAIVVTAAASRGIEQRLGEQLAPGGRLVIPVESRDGMRERFLGGVQELACLEKDAQGVVHERALLAVSFVPLVEGR